MLRSDWHHISSGTELWRFHRSDASLPPYSVPLSFDSLLQTGRVIRTHVPGILLGEEPTAVELLLADNVGIIVIRPDDCHWWFFERIDALFVGWAQAFQRGDRALAAAAHARLVLEALRLGHTDLAYGWTQTHPAVPSDTSEAAYAKFLRDAVTVSSAPARRLTLPPVAGDPR